MDEEKTDDQVERKVVYETVSRSTSGNNLPMLIFIGVIVIAIVAFVLTRIF